MAPVFALRTESDLGIGDIAGVREFVDWAADIGMGFIQLLPINEMGSDNSPYNVISSVALEPLTLDAIAEWPIITYHEGYTGRGIIDRTFAQAGLAPDIVMSAMDTDVLKAYVELGLGVGIIAAMAFDSRRDAGLKLIDAAHLFEVNTALVGVRRGSYLRNYAYRFIELCSPALPERAVRAAVMAEQGRPEAAARRTLEAPYRSNGNTLSREEVRRTG